MAEPTNDLTASFQARSQSASTSAALAEIQARVASATPPPGQPAPAPPPARATNGDVMGEMRDTIIKGAKAGLKAEAAVAGDVAGGVAEAIPQAIGGVMDAFGNAATGLDHVGDWLNSHVGDLTVDIPKTGIGPVDLISSVLTTNPLEFAGQAKGAIGAAKTVTGGMVRDLSNFLAGFVPALKAAKGIGLTGFAAGSTAGALTAGTVIDPNSPNVAKLINETVNVPPALKPIVDALSTNPEDPELLNRARQMIDDAGFGFAIEGALRGVRTVARARKAMSGDPLEKSKDPLEAMRAEYNEAKAEEFAPLGDMNKPAVSVSAAKLDAAAKATDGRVSLPTEGEGTVFINFARIDEPDTIKSVMDKMAGTYGQEAKGAVASHAEIRAMADATGVSAEELLSGKPLARSQVLAARDLWAASATKLVELAGRASSLNAGDVDKYMFRKMMATHVAIQNEVLGRRAEAARNLGAWRIPAKGGVDQARAIKHLLTESGGGAVSVELAKRVARLSAQGVTGDGLNAAIRKGWGATTVDAVKEAYVTGLLWSPSTHIVNTMSNSLVALQQIYERQIGHHIGQARTLGDSEIAPGEAGAMAYAMFSSLGDAFAMAGKTLRTGEQTGGFGKSELLRERAISAEAFGAGYGGMNAAQIQAFKETGLGKAVDFIGFAGSTPTRALAAGDEFFKTIGYRMELHAQATRMAHAEGLQGKAFAEKVADVINNPPESVRIASADAALYNTFQSPSGEGVRAFMALRNWFDKGGPPIGTMLFPFLKTPGNILNYTFERTPAAPLVGRWRSDIKAGGARKDLALARLASGTAVMATAFDFAESGLLTGAGPTDLAEREALEGTGWKPYSVYIAGKGYVSYQRGDPLAMALAFAATAVEKWKRSESSPEDLDEWQEYMAAGVTVASEVVVDKSFFQGFSNMVETVKMARSSPGAVDSYIGRTIAPLVPFSTALNTAKRFTDPVTRQVMNPYDAIAARTPIASQQLPARHNLWGFPVKPDEVYGRAYDVMSPFAVSEVKDSPIDAEMARMHYGKERIGVSSSFEGVQVNFRDFPNVYNKYTRLAGHELKHIAWGVGAKEFLDNMVTGKGPLSSVYNLRSDEEKEKQISETIDEYRDQARREIMANPQTDEEIAFVDYVRQKQDEVIAAKMPR